MSGDEVEEECCNSGCNNCILDVRQRQQSEKLKRVSGARANLFDGTYRQFKVTKIDKLTPNTLRMEFKFYNDNGTDETKVTLALIPTQHLMLRVPATSAEVRDINRHDTTMDEDFVSRPYTPLGCDPDELSFEILVKLLPNGIMSKRIAELRAGDLTEWKGVYGQFAWACTDSDAHLICISQGVAVAPLFNLVTSILENEADETRIRFIVCYRNLDESLLRKELSAARQFWNFSATIYLSQESCPQCESKRTTNCSCVRSRLSYGETVCNYRLDQEELEVLYAGMKPAKVFTVFCGTDELEKLVEGSIDIKEKDNYFRI